MAECSKLLFAGQKGPLDTLVVLLQLHGAGILTKEEVRKQLAIIFDDLLLGDLVAA